jgi:hypothetical protein
MTSSVTSVPSFNPPPVTAAPQVTVPAPVYQTEGYQTEGLIEPRQIEADKAAYLQNVNVQLNVQIEAAEREANIKKQMLQIARDAQILQMELQLAERYAPVALQVEREAQGKVIVLSEAVVAEKTSVEEQFVKNLAEFHKKKAIENMNIKAYELQRQWYEGESKKIIEYQEACKLRKSTSDLVRTIGPSLSSRIKNK